jgi:hypothetical protein
VPKQRRAAVVWMRKDNGTTEIFPGAVGAVRSGMRRFLLDRLEDISHVSGTGFIAQGVVFGDGTAVLRWTVALKSTAIYDSMDDLLAIHGHDGKTRVCYLDDECSEI